MAHRRGVPRDTMGILRPLGKDGATPIQELWHYAGSDYDPRSLLCQPLG